jgi:hypothetical protein
MPAIDASAITSETADNVPQKCISLKTINNHRMA